MLYNNEHNVAGKFEENGVHSKIMTSTAWARFYGHLGKLLSDMGEFLGEMGELLGELDEFLSELDEFLSELDELLCVFFIHRMNDSKRREGHETEIKFIALLGELGEFWRYTYYIDPLLTRRLNMT